MPGEPAKRSSLNQATLDQIHGRVAPEEKRRSLAEAEQRWWRTYSRRKQGDEYEDNADGLVYEPEKLPGQPAVTPEFARQFSKSASMPRKHLRVRARDVPHADVEADD